MSMPSQSREINRSLNLDEYRRGCIELASRPQFLVIELTQTCNLRCPMCRPDASATANRVMTSELFERVAEDLFPLAMMVDLRGWGESLILPDIVKHIDKAASFGANIRFVTNLSFRRPAVLEKLAEHGCHVAVSIDAADPELFRALRGGAKLDLVASNIDLLTSSYEKRFGTTERLYFTTTVQKPALTDLPNIIDFAADHRIKEVRLFSVTVENDSPLGIEGEAERIDEILNQAGERARQRGVRLIAGTRLGSMPENRLDIPACLHPWAYAYVSYSGAVGFCDHLVGIPGEAYHLGHLQGSSFEEIWNGPGWQALRREHLGNRDPKAPKFHECGWCYKNRYIDFEHFFDPEASSRIVTLTSRRNQ
jgi:MoaA/NifB/PqqE/SkfB family radical SAM enzyme